MNKINRYIYDSKSKLIIVFISSSCSNQAIHQNSKVLKLNSFQRIRYGTPTWLKAGTVSGGMRGIEYYKRD